MVDEAPLSREARKAQTREAIIAAATDLFFKKGIEATSLDRIAQEVGLTKGAIYSTFASKDELVEAVAWANENSVAPDALLDPEIPLREGLGILAKQLMAARKRIHHSGILLDVELFLYERRHASWGKRTNKERRDAFVEFAEKLELAVEERGETLPVPALHFSYALQALAQGIVLSMERDPKSFTNESVIKLFEALAD